MSGLTIFFTVSGAVGLMAVPMVLKQEPNMPVGAIKIVLFVGLIVLAVPLAIAIWWLVLFTRARVRVEFATPGAAVVSNATPSTAIATGFAPPFAAAPSGTKIPISIRVIVILFLVFGGFTLLCVPFAIRTNMPNMV